MKNVLFTFVFVCCLLWGNMAWAQVNELPRSNPEAEGIPSQAISAFMDSLMTYPHSDIHSVMILRHGKVIAEVYPDPYKAEYKHTMYSCSKTFTSTAVGLAVDDNLLRITDRVAAFFPELLPEKVSPELASMTVHDLLIMASGIVPDGSIRATSDDWIRNFLAKPVSTPGQEFKYDSLCTYLLSAIVQKVTGMKLLDYLKLKLFHEMHITDVGWEESPEGIHTGGWGLQIQCESLAKMGLLLLNHGRWNGKQLVSEAWVKAMMTNYIDTGNGMGYGYQMWACPPQGAFRADGRLGQFILVLPETDMVVAITECTWNPQLHYVWDVIFPAVQEKALSIGKEYTRLQEQLQSYRYPVARGRAKSSLMSRLEGNTYRFGKNELGWVELSFTQKRNEMILHITDEQQKTYDLSLGYKQWNTNVVDAYPLYSMTARQKCKGLEGPFAMAGCYAWNPSSLTMKIEYVDWISAADITLTMQGENIQLSVQKNYEEYPEIMKGILK